MRQADCLIFRQDFGLDSNRAANHQRVLGKGVRWSNLCLIKANWLQWRDSLFNRANPPSQSPSSDFWHARFFSDESRTPSLFSSEEFLERDVSLPHPQDYYLIFFLYELGAWVRWNIPRDNFSPPFQDKWINHLEPTGTGPTKSIPCGLQTYFCLLLHDNGYLSDLDFHITGPTPTHLVPKQVLNHSRDKPSQAERVK